MKWAGSNQPELKRLSSLLLNPVQETLGGYWALAIQIFDFLKGTQMEHHLSGSDLDLNVIHSGAPLPIDLVLPPDELESHSGLLRLWIGSCISVITRRRQQPCEATLMLIDEAAQLGALPQLRQAIMLRGYGVRIGAFWQEMSQIRNLYPDDRETILNYRRIQQFFGTTSGLAARAVSEVSGVKPPEMIQDLERDEMILNVWDDEPVIVGEPNYRWDPAFQGLYQRNPFYPLSSGQEDHRRTRAIDRKTTSPASTLRLPSERATQILSNRIFQSVDTKDWEPLHDQKKNNCSNRSE